MILSGSKSQGISVWGKRDEGGKRIVRGKAAAESVLLARRNRRESENIILDDLDTAPHSGGVTFHRQYY
jgi:hypothetical protein